MGQCVSSGAAGGAARAAAAPRDTALVLLPDGDLREYPRPVTAARVLDDASSSSASGSNEWILCDADRMGFEGPVSPVPSTEPLRAGQIYFVLPAAAAGRRGLAREEVAALAVRASAALSRAAAAAAASSGSGSGRRRRGAVTPLVFAPPEEEDDRQPEVNEVERALALKAAAAQPRLKRRPTPRPGRRLERFASDLMAIPECEMAASE